VKRVVGFEQTKLGEMKPGEDNAKAGSASSSRL
jgi:hypothetical protein